MKNALKKLIVIICICAVFGVFALVDLIVKSTYEIEFVSVNRVIVEQDEYEDVPSNYGVADGTTVVRFVIRLTKNGKKVSGHTLYVKTNQNILSRSITDENGEIVIDYTCYRAGKYSKINDITLTVRDENNSIFIFIPIEKDYTLKMVKGKAEKDSSMTTNDIFFEID